MALKPMRTTLLVALVLAVAIAAALLAPLAGAKAKVTIRSFLTVRCARRGHQHQQSAARPLFDGRRVSSRTGTELQVTVPLRFVSLDNSRIVVRDGKSRAVLSTKTFSGRYFLKPWAPVLALTATPMGPTTARSASISWRTNGGRTSCAIDGRTAKPCASPLRLTGLTLGAHDVKVTVYAHNSESAVHAIWTVRKPGARYATLRRHRSRPPAATTPTAPTTTPTRPRRRHHLRRRRRAAATTAPTLTTLSAPASTLTPAQFEARAVPGATISNAHVTGWVTITNPNVTVDHVDFDGGFTIQPAADDLHVVGGSAQSFYLWGAKRAVIDGTVFDGKGVTDDAKLWGSGGKLPSLTLRNCVMRHFSHDADSSSHNQALFIGSSESVIVEGCRFEDNGNTGHLFVSSFGVNTAVPGYVCIRRNTFGDTHGAYFAVNVHPDEIPTSARVYVEPGQSTVKPLASNSAFVRACG